MNKQTLKTYLKIGILLLGVLQISRGCSNIEPLVENTTNIKYQPIASSEAADFFNSSTSKGLFNKTSNNLNLNIDLSSLDLQPIENTSLSMPIFKATTKYSHIHSEVFLVKVEDTILPFLLSRIPDNNKQTVEFSGIICITKLDGGFVNAYKMQNGLFISQLVRKAATSKKSQTSKSMTDPVTGCDETDPEFRSMLCGIELSEVVITAPTPAPTPTTTLNFDPRGIDTTNWNVSDPTTTYTGGGTSPGGGTSDATVFPCDDPIHGCDHDYEVDDKINNNLTNPCAKSIFTELDTEMLKKDILNKFMTTPTGVQLTFAESILKLFNDSNTFNYSITNGYLKDSNGSTTGGSTTISDSYLRNATQLSIARTMIHEMVHAYLNVKYANYIALNDWSFKDAMDKYAKDNGYNPNGTDTEKNRFQHEFMGQYVDAMAISLVSWDEKYGTGGIKTKDSNGNDVLNWEYYRSMAFGGLYYKDSSGNVVETDSFKTLVPKQSDRDKIKNIIINEQDGNYNSKGTKCN